jgi:hypothetical protein
MPPKDQRQPTVKQDSADTDNAPRQEPEWMAALFQRLSESVKTSIIAELSPRIDALEGGIASKRDDSSDDETACPSSRGRSKGKSWQRRLSHSKSSFRDRHRNRCRQRRRDRSYDHDDSNKDRRPRFRTDSLTTVRYGEEAAMWLLDMDYIVQKHGEEIVCPEIFDHCFQPGDAIKLWFMGRDPGFRAWTLASGNT